MLCYISLHRDANNSRIEALLTMSGNKPLPHREWDKQAYRTSKCPRQQLCTVVNGLQWNPSNVETW